MKKKKEINKVLYIGLWGIYLYKKIVLIDETIHSILGVDWFNTTVALYHKSRSPVMTAYDFLAIGHRSIFGRYTLGVSGEKGTFILWRNFKSKTNFNNKIIQLDEKLKNEDFTGTEVASDE